METYDLAIVGAGPAGLSAAINGASELKRVVLIDSGKKTSEGNRNSQMGGQAIGSTSIENYAGFPDGITGLDLMERFVRQALKFKTEFYCPHRVSALELMPDGLKRITTQEGAIIFARSVIVSAGLSYQKLSAPGVEQLVGRGVLYGAPTSNPDILGSCRVGIVGGANSAGQAVLHLSKNPSIEIKMFVRNEGGLQTQMSQYLVDRITQMPNVEVIAGVEVAKACGEQSLQEIQLKHRTSNTSTTLPLQHLFIFIGAAPKNDWLKGVLATTPKGFIISGSDLGVTAGRRLPFETSMPGVFVAGDIREGSVKRVASAVGEGAQALSWVHRYLSESDK